MTLHVIRTSRDHRRRLRAAQAATPPAEAPAPASPPPPTRTPPTAAAPTLTLKPIPIPEALPRPPERLFIGPPPPPPTRLQAFTAKCRAALNAARTTFANWRRNLRSLPETTP